MAKDSYDDLGLDTTMLAGYEDEMDFMKKSKSTKKYMPKVKIDKNHQWLLRFLPVKIGTDERWFGRFAQHWLNQKPYTCKTKTAPGLGGDPKHECIICSYLESAQSQNLPKAAKERAETLFAEPRWFAVALVLAKDTGAGSPTVIRPPERWIPHEVPLWQPHFEQLWNIYRQHAVEGTDGLLDMTSGASVWFNRTQRGTMLRPIPPSPIVPLKDRTQEQWQEQMQEAIDAAWGAIHFQTIEIMSPEAEQEAADKMWEYITTGYAADAGSKGRSNAPRQQAASGPIDSYDDVDGVEAGEPGMQRHSPARATAPTRPAAPAPRPAPAPAAAAAPAPRPAPRPAPTPAPRPAPAPAAQAAPAAPAQPAPAAASPVPRPPAAVKPAPPRPAPPATAAPAAPAEHGSPAPVPRPPAAVVQRPAPAAPAPRTAASAPAPRPAPVAPKPDALVVASGDHDEDAEPPAGDAEHAPASEEALVEDPQPAAETVAEPTAAPVSDVPPAPVAQKTGDTKLGSSVRSRLLSVTRPQA